MKKEEEEKEEEEERKREKAKRLLEKAEVKPPITTIEKEDKSEKFVRAVVQALTDKIYDRKKAWISTKNENGILKAKAINTFLRNNFDFENRVLIELEEKKIDVSLSVKGRGIEKIIDFGKAFGYQVMSSEEEGITKGIIRRR